MEEKRAVDPSKIMLVVKEAVKCAREGAREHPALDKRRIGTPCKIHTKVEGKPADSGTP